MKRPPIPRPATPDTAAELLGRVLTPLIQETQAAAHQVAACIGLLTVVEGRLWAPAPLPLLVAATCLSPSGVRNGLARALQIGLIVRRGEPRGRGHGYEYALAAAVVIEQSEEAAGHPVRAGPTKKKRSPSRQMDPADSDVQPAAKQAEQASDPDRPDDLKSPVP